MLSQVDSSAILGIDAYIVRVEVDISSSLAMFTIVGLPDAAVQESRERVRSASEEEISTSTRTIYASMPRMALEST